MQSQNESYATFTRGSFCSNVPPPSEAERERGRKRERTNKNLSFTLPIKRAQSQLFPTVKPIA